MWHSRPRLWSADRRTADIHEFRAATEADFDKLDRTAYDAATRELESRGFRQLGDVVDSTIEKLRGVTPVLRVFASADGAIKAAAYHFALGPTRRRPEGLQLFVCDLGTEFTDGTFLASSNTEGVDLMTPPPAIRKLLRPPGTPIGVMLAAHESEQKAVLAVNPSLAFVPVRTLADALAAAEREQAAKNAFRKEIGFADPEEVRRIAQKRNVSDEVANGTAHAVTLPAAAKRSGIRRKAKPGSLTDRCPLIQIEVRVLHS